MSSAEAMNFYPPYRCHAALRQVFIVHRNMMNNSIKLIHFGNTLQIIEKVCFIVS